MPGLRRRCRSNQAPDTGPASNRQHHPQRLRNPAAPPQPRAATPASEIPLGALRSGTVHAKKRPAIACELPLPLGGSGSGERKET